MFPSGLCVVVGRLASRRGRLAARRGTIGLGIMGGMEPEGRLGARCVLAWWREGRLAARRGTIVLGIMGASSSAQAPSRPLESWTTARNARDKRR